jgi:signal transduction histidine kinase
LIAKDKLLTVLAHEIRTPLGGVIGSLQLMENHFERLHGGMRNSDKAVMGELSSHLSVASVRKKKKQKQRSKIVLKETKKKSTRH